MGEQALFGFAGRLRMTRYPAGCDASGARLSQDSRPRSEASNFVSLALRSSRFAQERCLVRHAWFRTQGRPCSQSLLFHFETRLMKDAMSRMQSLVCVLATAPTSL